MSSMSLHLNRKRIRSPDIGDTDSEDEFPPCKLRKRENRADFPLSFKEKIKTLSYWIADLPVKRFFKMAIRNGGKLNNETIILDDENEEEIFTETVKKGIDRSKLTPLIEKYEHPEKLFPRDSPRSRKKSELNGSFSLGSCFDTHRCNGLNPRDWDLRLSENDNYFSRQSLTDHLKRPALISNPETDIEILLDPTANVPAPEADEIEILSESPSTKKKPANKSHRLTLKPLANKDNAMSVHQSERHLSAVKRTLSSSAPSFTCNEVVRLQEKAQYKLLLDKYINGSFYHPTVKKHSEASVQSDELPKNLFTSSHFKKEVLQQPVNTFIEKYVKPCQLLTPDSAKQSNEKNIAKQSSEKKDPPPEIKIYDDDDIEILEVKLPTVKPKYKSTKYFSSKWISELRDVLREQTVERMKIVQEQERMLEQCRKERILNILKLDSTAGQAVEPEFPELTPEMEEEIDKILNTGGPEDRICRVSGQYVYRKDFETLNGLNWLNDLVINSYFDLIVERSKQEGYPSLYAFNTFFYSSYKLKGYSSVRRWTRKIDIFSFDLNFVPIHMGVHWCLAIIDHREKKICYYDSMGNGEEYCLDLLHEYLSFEHKDKKGAYLDSGTYAMEVMKDIPQQMNGSDCGMFTLKYAEYVSRDAEITFNQSHMHYFRRRMVYELLKSQLL